MEGMSGPIQFDHFSSRRSYPALYNVLEISQFLVAKASTSDEQTLTEHVISNCPGGGGRFK